ncbi:hypothetical protein SPRG_13183 [Saprolegnia parasitica CBS 223.65]|uniref:Uncharacterized protein n=1 Tax=Saprolegnia parasitica (strain CBS 223.65) TaxID=695850 RepID=A0A067BTE3_SAPPC|nr:hypothetical protein SPRG_13183 [Saprolegnia parasitica CBS 223.65]KDO21769.1 hypothetical protein SPRG_13183 [Saprolegnia parasitica CBS 223.65]|eukprot:XP_012207569.1 hypothetical protein SPRG_13183 [Saprolegnia parasitica CBS 223.65]
MTACLHQEAGLPPLQVATAKVHTDRSYQCYVRLQKILPCLIALFIVLLVTAVLYGILTPETTATPLPTLVLVPARSYPLLRQTYYP